MSKKKDKKDKKKKGSQLVFRVEKEDKERFLEVCQTLDTSAGREIRRFMRDFVEAHVAATAKDKKAGKKRAKPDTADETPEVASEPVAPAPVTEDIVEKAKAAPAPRAPRAPRAASPRATRTRKPAEKAPAPIAKDPDTSGE